MVRVSRTTKSLSQWFVRHDPQPLSEYNHQNIYLFGEKYRIVSDQEKDYTVSINVRSTLLKITNPTHNTTTIKPPLYKSPMVLTVPLPNKA